MWPTTTLRNIPEDRRFKYCTILIQFHRYVIFLYLKFCSSVGTLTGPQAGRLRNLGSIAGTGMKLILFQTVEAGPVAHSVFSY
jgi:hypothetical protein